MTLQRKIALVTGGSRGIGAATAKKLAADGAIVAINYLHNSEAADKVVEQIKQDGGDALSVQANALDEAEVSRMVSQIVDKYQHLDILVSNAAVPFVTKSFADIIWSELIQKVDDELHAAFVSIKAVLPVMKKQHYGRIVCIGSIAGRAKDIGMIAHGTSKAALEGFIRYVANEVGRDGITINNLMPNLIETDQTSDAEDLKRHTIEASPLGRFGHPEDVANVVAFFASDASGYLTGTSLFVTGGEYMI